MSKTTANAFGTWFVVKYTTFVDRPELRDASLPVVRPGTTIANRSVRETQGAAIALATTILAGEFDYASEFVACVEVVQCYGDGRPSRVVRKRVERERIEGTDQARAA